MGNVTAVVLHISSADESKGMLREVNEFFAPDLGFVSVKDPSLPRAWYGGRKMLERGLAIGSFNELDLQGLCAHLTRLQWVYPDEVQLMVCEQDEFRFRILNIFDVEPDDDE